MQPVMRLRNVKGNKLKIMCQTVGIESNDLSYTFDACQNGSEVRVALNGIIKAQSQHEIGCDT